MRRDKKEAPEGAKDAFDEQSNPKLDIRTVAAAALQSADMVAARWAPDGKREGNEWVALNPTRTDGSKGSFKINLGTGRWADFASDDKGGDFVSWVAYIEGCKQGEAARRLGQFLGLVPGPPGDPAPRQATPQPPPRPDPPAPIPLEPIPAEAMETRPKAHPKHGTPSKEWIYRDVAGNPLFSQCRFDPSQGGQSQKKQFAPLTWDANGWHWKAPPEPRPLYGLDHLAARPDAPVLICEGEKSTDAARELLPDFVVITTLNGAQSPKRTDFGPLKGRRVFIWPDNDPEGRKYAAAVATLAQVAGAASVSVLDLDRLSRDPETGAPRDLRKKWDAADAQADGWTPENLKKAARWEPFPEKRETKDPLRQAAGSEIPEGFELTSDGLFTLLSPARGGDEPRRLMICHPLHVLAVTRDERGEGWGRLLEWQDRDGVCRRWAAPLTMLAGSGETLRTELHRLGLEISTNPEARRRLLEYIMHSAPDARARSVTRTGWAGGVFVLPDRTIGEGAEPVIFQTETAEGPGFGERGTLDGWRRTVASLAVGNTRVVFAIACAFAAPLLELAGD